MSDKPRIIVGSIDYELWLLGLWGEARSWDEDIPKHNGLFSHTSRAMQKVHNQLASDIINGGQCAFRINTKAMPITINHINPKFLSQIKGA